MKMHITVDNLYAGTYYGYIKATIPFPKGQIQTEDQLKHFVTEDNEPLDFSIIKWHLTEGKKDSVALAMAHFRAKIAPQSTRVIKIKEGKAEIPPYSIGKEIIKMAINNLLNQNFLMSYTNASGQAHYASIEGSFDIQQISATRQVIRIRNHPRFNGITNKQISFTLYWELPSASNHGTLHFIVGNDTLEMPVAGGVLIRSVDILIKNNMEIGLFAPSTYSFGGVSDFQGYKKFNFARDLTLADGQTFAVKLRWGAFSGETANERESFLAAANGSPLCELIGVVDYDTAVRSEAFGPTGIIMKPRWSDLTQARNALMHHVTDNPAAPPYGHLGHINLNPPSTGDQPDFMGASPIFVQQALQTGCIFPLKSAMAACLKEAFRPSYYWCMGTNGVERRVEMNDWPDLFFWGSRLHYDWSWNGGKNAQQWQSRSNPFNAGNFMGWGTYDNQHYGLNSILGLYEMTFDPYMAEIIKYNKTIAYWDYYTGRASPFLGWFRHIEADRAFGRIGKHVSQFFQFFPDDGQLLDSNFRGKLTQIALPIVQTNKQNTGTAYFTTFEDPRVGLWTRCEAGEFTGAGVTPGHCATVVAWQTGFTMECLAQAIKNGQEEKSAMQIGQLFMDDAHKYFDEQTGNPVTYFLLANPTIRDFGGIGIQWWAGWLNLAKYFQNHPKIGIINKAKALIDAQIESRNAVDTFWKGADNWKSY